MERPQGSRFRTPNTSVRIRGADLSLRRSAPELGADLEAVPAEAGVGPDEAAELAAELAAERAAGGAFGSPAVLRVGFRGPARVATAAGPSRPVLARPPAASYHR